MGQEDQRAVGDRGWARRGAAAVVVSAGLLVTACAGASPATTGSPAPTTQAAAAVGAKPGAGDGCAAASQPGTATVTVRSGGRNRTVVVHVPQGLVTGRPVPLVLNLHGSGSNAAEQQAFSGMDATADTDHFIVAYPQGAIPDGASGFDWNVPGQPLIGGRAVPQGAADDVAFVANVMTAMERQHCIDPKRVYATGFSGGARLASQLGCDLASRVAAVAPVSGLRFPAPCPASRPVPVVAFHGTADPVDPYGGHGQAYWTESVPDAAQQWAAHDGCAATPVTSAPAPSADLATYPGCGGGAVVELYTLQGAGHTWPGGPPVPKRLRALLGPESTAVQANAVMWAFFEAHPLP